MPWPVNEIEHERTRQTERGCPVPSQSHPMVGRRIEVLVSELLNYDERVDSDQTQHESVISDYALHHLTRTRSATADDSEHDLE
jgi:hypothetical protein